MKRRERMMKDREQDIPEHIETETQNNIARGISPEEAHCAAMRKFGNVTRVKEETREVWTLGWLNGSPNCTICEPSDLRFQEFLAGKMQTPSNLICPPPTSESGVLLQMDEYAANQVYGIESVNTSAFSITFP
jgi:hypothetical protein